MKKILIASEFFHPHWTGISKAIFFAAKDLIRRGDSITVVTTQFKKELTTYEKLQDMTVIRVPYLFKISRTYFAPQTLMAILRCMHSIDTVLINSPHSNILFIALIAKLFRKKLIIFHQGDLNLPRQSGNLITNWVIEKIFDLSTISAFFIADTISTFTFDYAKHSRVMRYFIKKCIPYIPSLKKPTAIKPNSIQKKLKTFSESHILIGFAGRFVEEKGFDILLQSIPNIIKKIPNALFVFAGETNMGYEHFYEKNKERINDNKDRILFLGLLNNNELTFFYNSLTIFILPSRSDCLALTQVEAGLAGCPLVVTDIPGARMLVKETGIGRLCNPNDPKSLAESIIYVINNLNTYRNIEEKVSLFLKKYETPPIN